MNEAFTLINKIIKQRRSVFPKFYKKGNISNELLEEILENARWAPTHKKTEPWRFVVIRDEKLALLSEKMQSHYKNTTPPDKYDALKFQKAGDSPMQSAAVIAICIERSPVELIPAWEETAALACAVQNIWLSCTALGLGAYWSSPGIIKSLGEFLGLAENQECLGLFYMGWTDVQLPDNQRKELKAILKYL